MGCGLGMGRRGWRRAARGSRGSRGGRLSDVGCGGPVWGFERGFAWGAGYGLRVAGFVHTWCLLHEKRREERKRIGVASGAYVETRFGKDEFDKRRFPFGNVGRGRVVRID